MRTSAANSGQLVIPQSVTLFYDFGTARAVRLTGDLTNAGTFYAFSSNPLVTTAQISANNIYNKGGALISTILPSSVTPGVGSAVPNLSLSISAVNDIVNAGAMTSGGKLILTAGGSIVNALPAGVSGARPVMQAKNAVNLGAANISNSGQIASLFTNINVTTQAVQDITVNNTGGQLQARSGAITFRNPNFAGQANISLSGGDFLSRELNLYSGDGVVNANVGQVSGTLNIQAGQSHVTASSDTLILGHDCVKGDPTFYNTGDIAITNTVTANENLAILAQGNITATTAAAEIMASNGTQGFDVLMIAGAKLTYSSTGNSTSSLPTGANPIPSPQTVTVDFSTGPGGNIDLSSSVRTNVINTAGAANNGAGGNVTLVAVANGSTGGRVTLPIFAPIDTSGFGSGAGGNVRVVAGASSGTTITAGGITTGGGAVSLNAALPTTTAFPLVVDSHGSIISGAIFSTSVLPGDIVLNEPINAGSGTVSVEGAGAISGTGLLTGGNVLLFAGRDIGAASSRIGTSSSIVQAFTTAGSIFLEGQSSGTVNLSGVAGPGQTLDFRSAEGTNGTIAVLMNGAIRAPGGTINLSADGSGNIENSLARTLTADTVNLQSGTGSIGTSLFRILTDASTVTANTGGGNVFLQNSRSVTLGASSGGNGSTFDLQTKSGSNGGITVAGDVAATAGMIDTIRLAGDGVGGIARTAGTLTAANVQLSSDAGGIQGNGSGNIGSSNPANNVFTQAAFLTAQTNGNVFVQQSGACEINTSSAGEGATFSVIIAPGSRGSIVLNGNIAATAGTIGTITLRSDGPGIINGVGNTLTANSINLSSDSGATIGAGTGDIRGSIDGAFLVTNAGVISMNTKGNVFVQNSGGVSIGASSAGDGKTFDVQIAQGSNGAIFVSRDIVAMTGTIGTIQLASDGTGGVGTGIHTLTANNINLSSDASGVAGAGSGDIFANVSATNLTANTTGSVSVVAVDSVILGPSSAGNAQGFGLNTRIGSGGSITLAGNVAATTGSIGTILLASDGAGGISRVAGTLTASNVNLSSDSFGMQGAGTGNIGSAVAGAQIFTAAGTLKANTNGSVFIKQTGNVTLDASGSNAGDAQTFSVSTVPASNGVINVFGNVTAGTIILAAGGTGGILGIGGKLLGDTIDLMSAGGAVGSSGLSPLQTAPDTAAADTVSVSAGGNVFITNSGAAILGQSTSGGSFNFTSTGGMTVGGPLTTANGGASLVASAGVLSVVAGAKITVNQGNLLIQNAVGGSIKVGAGTVISTASPTKTLGLIDIVIGAVPSTPVKGPKVANVKVKVTKPGLVLLGTNGITASAPTNTLSALKQNIVFSTSTQPATAISLGGGVKITADPVFSGTGAHRALGRSALSPGEAVSSISVDPVGGRLEMPMLGPVPDLSGSTNPGDLTPFRTTIDRTDQVENSLDVQPLDKTRALQGEESATPLELIAFKPSATYSGAAAAEIQTLNLGCALIKYAEPTAIREREPGCLELTRGEVLVSTIRPIRLECGGHSISVSPGAVVLVSREDNLLKVRSLYAQSVRAVRFLVNSEWISLAAGGEVICGLDGTSVRQAIQSDRLGRRQVTRLVAKDGQTLVRSEVSLVSLMQRNTLVRSLNMSHRERGIRNRVTRMAACLMQVTGGHGPYSIYADIDRLPQPRVQASESGRSGSHDSTKEWVANAHK